MATGKKRGQGTRGLCRRGGSWQLVRRSLGGYVARAERKRAELGQLVRRSLGGTVGEHNNLTAEKGAGKNRKSKSNGKARKK